MYACAGSTSLTLITVSAGMQKTAAKVLAFGGKANGYSNRLWELELKSRTTGSEATLSWRRVDTSGTAPSARYGHSAVLVHGSAPVAGDESKHVAADSMIVCVRLLARSGSA